MSWLEVSVEFKCAPEDWSPIIDVLRNHGLENTLQTDSPPVVKACVVAVSGAEEQIESLREDLMALGALIVAVQPYLEQDWEEAWKKFFVPRRVGKHFVVRPTWENFAPEVGDHIIVLDPGQAFGTGDHPTTRMCLALLEDLALAGKRVLDVGCGSGVLSIGAKMLGASEVLGTDVDPLALEIAKENAALNEIAIDLHACDGIPESLLLDRAPKWNVVLSNLISAAVMRIAPDVALILAPGGSWIVSGILNTNWVDVLRVAEGVGLRLGSKHQEDDWVAATFHR